MSSNFIIHTASHNSPLPQHLIPFLDQFKAGQSLTIPDNLLFSQKRPIVSILVSYLRRINDTFSIIHDDLNHQVIVIQQTC